MNARRVTVNVAAALVALLVAAVLVLPTSRADGSADGAAGGSARSYRAVYGGAPSGTGPVTSSTTSSVVTSSTTTTMRSTTTTVRPTSTTARPSSTTTTAPTTTTASTTTERTGTTESTAPTTTAATTTSSPGTTLARKAAATNDGSGLRVVVGGLIGIAAVISVLTFLYWRHTKPEDEFYPYGEPVDDGEEALAGGELAGVGAAGAAEVGLGRGEERGDLATGDGGPPTEQLPALHADAPPVQLDPEPLRIVTREDLERGTGDAS